MFSRSAYENSRPGGFAVLEVTEDRGKQEAARFVPLRRTHLSGAVAGPLASLRLTQTFGYSRRQCDRVLEAVYRFPLPGDAAVTAVRVRFGEVEIEASLVERRQAEEAYAQARQQGRQAALATRESPDVFTLQVAGIRPDEDVTVDTSYVLLARAEGSGWSLRVPLTTAPRYVRQDEMASRHAQGQPLYLLRDPGHRFSLDVSFTAAGEVGSPTHGLAVAEAGETTRVQLAEGEVLPDRDCLLLWRPPLSEARPSLQVLLGRPEGDEGLYFAALVAPPAAPPRRRPSQEATLLVDHSGSMRGAKWQAADWAVRQFLAGLGEDGLFNLCLFHSTTRWFREAPVPATPENVEAAVRFLSDEDTGGTELGVALEQALSQARPGGVETRHVFVITDAEVSDAGRILRLAEEESVRPDRRRISVLCIDAAPNSHLAYRLAERGGGVARFLTSAPEEDDVTTALDAILEDWAQPLLVDLRLGVRSAAAPLSDRSVRHGDGLWQIDMGDMPGGRTTWTVGRVPAADVAFRLTAGGRELVPEAAANVVEVPELAGALRALSGARRVLALEYLASAYYDPQEVAAELRRLGYEPADASPDRSGKLYPENRAADSREVLRGLLAREALRYGIASAETAFVAVRREAGQVVEGTVAVANALPAGWSEGFLGSSAAFGAMAAPFPQTRSAGAFGLADRLFAGRSMPSMAAPPTPPARAASGDEAWVTVYSGTPALGGGEAVLLDSQDEPAAVAADALISGVAVTFPEGAPADIDRGLVVLIYLGDMSLPAARARLADLARQGERPLNLSRRGGEPVRLVLADANGAWRAAAPSLEVRLRYA